MDEGKDILMMTREEIQRYQVIRKVLEKTINQQEAAEYLCLTDRQIRRVVFRVRREGESGVIHKLRGHAGCRRIKAKKRERILKLYKDQYGDFGPLLASEKLLERDGIRISDETLRLWLIQEGLWQARKTRAPQERSWRPRKDHHGEMVQMDGSHHDWLEGRGPKLVLIGFIDDATGKIFGRFFDYEGTMPAMGSLKGYIKLRGIPRSVYLDKHSAYKNNQKLRYTDWPFRDKAELTQFERACRQLGIEVIHAHSPQAKGRVERLFKTLQDRLVKELRLAGASSGEEANALLDKYLDVFNKKFGRLAKKSGDWHRSVDQRVKLTEILSIQTDRQLRNDRTVLHGNRWYQITERTRASRVKVYEYLNGGFAIKYGRNQLTYKPIEGPVARMTAEVTRKVKPRGHWVPAKDNPWRNLYIAKRAR